MADRGTDEDNIVGEDHTVTTSEMEVPTDQTQLDGDQTISEENNIPGEDGHEIQNGGDTQIGTQGQDGESTQGNDNDNREGDDKLNDYGNVDNGDIENEVVNEEGINNDKDSGLNHNDDSPTPLPSPTDEDNKSDNDGKSAVNDALGENGHVQESVGEKELGESSLMAGHQLDNVNVTQDTQSKEELGISIGPEQKQELPSIVSDANKRPSVSNEQHITSAKTVDVASKDPDIAKQSTDKGDITPALNTSLPLLTPGKPFIGAIPASDVIYSPRDTVIGSRTRIPPKFMRMSTVAMINR